MVVRRWLFTVVFSTLVFSMLSIRFIAFVISIVVAVVVHCMALRVIFLSFLCLCLLG